ncbi:MAG: flavodoxin-dependent (E)-4-hydroxy-3-methylbut-2-enyl-diphosphate synthase [Oscillospiraceae bacterium]|nr:flavodoxin-dependent (E)-4-hydroxy-3-methylbut-2-enyl-diphosphate synthase [Oscillospiraceae bacterium]MDD3833016.1 flavodoxin-dependent (E)-4-hydroxy-3-methylbut-2-enyl-diphosphate synthase [Oscillospiraceae bacterium]MDD4546761.1 flavodoxin-dependent (E)-4-hydroxy-3-methylbut-2-enyl-diphosphate synthase [Oscillospiraceae bacterium]
MSRRKTRVVNAGGLNIGGDNPVSIQTMLNTPAHDIEAGVEQAKRLEEAGCELLRAAVPDLKSVQLISALKYAVSIPIVADIHFDYKLAIESAAAGIDKIRINPGNIGDQSRVKKVADECRRRGIPIRIGVNSGSLERDILAKYGHPTPEAMRDSAMYHVSLLEKFDFNDIVISIKSSDVQTMVRAYELVADVCDYPLHLGVTEAGTQRMGMLKSAAGIGALLLHGIGDTIRISLTADPQREVEAAHDLLRGIGLSDKGATLISCPTCGRTGVDLINIAQEVEKRLRDIKKPITVAVMGCIVNGPGEAREADVGIAGGKGKVAIFRKGEIVRTVDEAYAVEELMKEIEALL